MTLGVCCLIHHHQGSLFSPCGAGNGTLLSSLVSFSLSIVFPKTLIGKKIINKLIMSLIPRLLTWKGVSWQPLDSSRPANS